MVENLEKQAKTKGKLNMANLENIKFYQILSSKLVANWWQ